MTGLCVNGAKLVINPTNHPYSGLIRLLSEKE